MKIIKAKNIGFCGGVKKAFKMVDEKFTGSKKQGKIFVLGSLAHNRGVEKKIEEMGIEKITSLRKVKKGDTVIITAHGSSKAIYEKIKSRGARVFDTTCVNVKRVQQLVRQYRKKKWRIVIFGDKNHKEVKGILGHCDGKAIVASNLKEAKNFLKKMKKPVVLVSQTTKNINIFDQIKKEFEKFSIKSGAKTRIFDTICRASHIRQTEVEKLAKSCDLSIIIGGGESANTKRLWQIAKKVNGPVFWIKEVRNSLPANLKKKVKKLDKNGKICVISGASTPPWEIETVKKNLRQLTF